MELMTQVGIPVEFLHRYPHQFSGGQRQRIGIARALALRPKLIVCDEPVSALDVSIQSQVLNLLDDLQESYDLTYLFISHDLSVVRHISDRVCVMFLGKICEIGETGEIYEKPMHPYTRFLLDSVPKPDPTQRDEDRELLTGEIPSPVNPPSGCRFRTRCPYATELCAQEAPEMKTYGTRQVACHHPLET
jgi:oligopeptide/dipeptide ABC transporter ATP-binding protein